jgi:hypothetical protein
VALSSALALAVRSGNGAAGLRYGNIALQLKDAPGNLMKAVVTIDRLYLTDDVIAGLPTLAELPNALVTNLAVPAHEYRQMRFAISGAYVELVGPLGRLEFYASSPTYNGLPAGALVAGELTLPGRKSTGLNFETPNESVTLDADGSLVLIVDFDVALEFTPGAAKTDKWRMSAAIHASVPTTV